MTDRALQKRLGRELEGDVLFDPASRGRYSTDASIYQITPRGVILPRTREDVARAMTIAADAGVSVTPRGGGTSQSGQSIGAGLIVDDSKYLDAILELDVDARTCRVEPGVVLEDLNRRLAPHDLFFPVDVSTANRATIGGMTGNNSAGTRSIKYGVMADHVSQIEMVLPDGSFSTFAPGHGGHRSAELMALYLREAEELAIRVPDVMRHVAGYNLHRLGGPNPNPAEVLVGSEGTLGMFTSIDLRLSPRPGHRALGIAHFDTLRGALDAAQYIVQLGPSAVELVDHKLIRLARDIPEFASLVSSFVRGEPAGLLFVEFAGPDPAVLTGDLQRLGELLADRGLTSTVVPATTPAEQDRVWAVRKAGLNIVMSMKGDSKPVSFIEDCTVPLTRLAEYHDRLNEVFERNGTTGTWYAHASVGCLHVRPALNLKTGAGADHMRAIAEQAHEIVREFGGSASGEHGDGLVRSEFIEPMLGSRLTRAFGEIKRLFDPENRLNPGKIISPGRMDDRDLFRYPPGYAALPNTPHLDWSDWGGLTGATEMCNNNGACRKMHDGSMCPSYRVTHDETHTTRGRANTLRLALTGQLGPDGLATPGLKEAMDLCVGCKACRRECPTGIDMARMKTEVLAAHQAVHGLPLRDRLIAHLPRYAPLLSRVAPLANFRNRAGWLGGLGERLLGLAASRPLPEWSRRPFRHSGPFGPEGGRPVVLFVDTFDRYFEPDNVHAAIALLSAAGYRTHLPSPADEGGPLCCGRTYLNAGMMDEARREASRTIESLRTWCDKGTPVIGLEPSCLLTFRDEFTALLPRESRSLAQNTFLVEEFVAAESNADRWKPATRSRTERVMVHGHCHQKAFGLTGSLLQALRTVPGCQPELIESSCCGMAGSFGYEAEHQDISRRMAELTLAPAVRASDPDTILLADGVSCRHQLHDTTGRTAQHVVRFLAESLEGAGARAPRAR